MTLLVHIAADHAALAGHFPGRPIVPAAVLLDEVLHALEVRRRAVPDGAAEGWGDAGGSGDAGGWRIEAVKFHQPVLPGQLLQLQGDCAPGGGLSFELRTHGRLYVSGTVSAVRMNGGA